MTTEAKDLIVFRRDNIKEIFMSKSKYDFAVIGGDARQWYLAEHLAKKGYSVITYAIALLPKDKMSDTAFSLKEAVLQAVNIIGPIPFTKDGTTIYSQAVESDLNIETLEKFMGKGYLLASGNIPEKFCKKLCVNGASYFDFMKEEEVAIFNSIATAEGTIAEALLRKPSNLHGSNCLVLGFGRCAKTLAQKLKNLCSNITVCARSSVAQAAAYAHGFDSVDFLTLPSVIEKYNYIFNTVPSLVISRKELECMDKDVLIIDIASAPGGVDYKAAKELGINAYLCLGLPGKYSPKSSAEALVKALLSYIKE